MLTLPTAKYLHINFMVWIMWYSSTLFIEKNPCISGQVQLESLLFKAQLYTQSVFWFPNLQK